MSLLVDFTQIDLGAMYQPASVIIVIKTHSMHFSLAFLPDLRIFQKKVQRYVFKTRICLKYDFKNNSNHRPGLLYVRPRTVLIA